MSRGSPICGAAGVSRSRPARPAGPPARVAPPRRGGGGRTRRPRGRPPEPVADVTRYGSLAVAARHAALEDPAGLAIADGLVRWTWRELNERVDSVALGLTNAGVEAGGRRALAAAPTAAAVAALHAIARIGAVAVPLDTRLTRAELVWVAAVVEPRVV